ncbi:MAG: NADPH:quinone reductase, partial [Candidatus Neomarinimicrobiota bacterium]
MKAVRIHAHGPVDVLRVDKIERPKPGPKEVLIQM